MQPQKAKIAFLCLLIFFFTASTAGFPTSPSLSLSLCGGRISNKTKKSTPGYVDVFQSSKSIKRATKTKKNLALATSTKLVPQFVGKPRSRFSLERTF